jgi:UDP-N-acetylmuramyl pentapeptide phosphotransferase/UDP-N-acetylglucosamine-1-phosphate transferase
MQIDLGFTAFMIPVSVLRYLGYISAFALTAVSIPTLVSVAKMKNLFADRNGRSSHEDNVPIVGGIAVFIGLIISLVFFTGNDEAGELKYIIAGLLILFFLGMKDDIIVLDPRKKFIGQIIASGVVVVMGGVQITSFQGFLGIYEIQTIYSILFSIFVFVVIINSFNLIDGIDGLASGVGILISAVYGYWFCQSGFTDYGITSYTLAGALSAFFVFNVFGKRNKVFLGDTGSLTLGFLVAILTIHFIEDSMIVDQANAVDSTPIVAFGILIVPLFDTLRVFILRIFRGQSPFRGDKRHVHHLLLNLGMSHFRATIIILAVNILFIFIAFRCQSIGDYRLLLLLLFLALFFSLIPSILLRIKKRSSAELPD